MNQRTSFSDTSCSIARTLNIVGEWWTLLILREIFFEIDQFSIIQEHLGISKKILANRLKTLRENEILSRESYEKVPPRYRYILTKKGKDLFPIILSLMEWGNKWIFGEKDVPVRLYDGISGKEISPIYIDRNTMKRIEFGNIRAQSGSDKFQNDWEKLNDAMNKCHPLKYKLKEN